MDYRDKLKDPRWQKKRLGVLERDGWACHVCSDKKKTLHVHHVNYIKGRDPWDYPEHYLVTLCEGCHEDIHSGLDKMLFFEVGDGINKDAAKKLVSALNVCWCLDDVLCLSFCVMNGSNVVEVIYKDRAGAKDLFYRDAATVFVLAEMLGMHVCIYEEDQVDIEGMTGMGVIVASHQECARVAVLCSCHLGDGVQRQERSADA